MKIQLIMFIILSSCTLIHAQSYTSLLLDSSLVCFLRQKRLNAANTSIQQYQPMEKRRRCKACEAKKKPMSVENENRAIQSVPEWSINRDEIHKITRIYSFDDFNAAMKFANRVAEVAEFEGHHPNILLFDYKNVSIELYTHSVKGLSKNDFILASMIESIWENEFLRVNR